MRGSVVLTIAAVGFVGCGSKGAPAPSDSPRATAEAYLEALTTGRGASMCPFLDAQARSELLAAAASEGVRTTDCETAGNRVLRAMQNGFRGAHVVSPVPVRGKVATADITGGAAGEAVFTFRRGSDGRWYVDEL